MIKATPPIRCSRRRAPCESGDLARAAVDEAVTPSNVLNASADVSWMSIRAMQTTLKYLRSPEFKG